MSRPVKFSKLESFILFENVMIKRIGTDLYDLSDYFYRGKLLDIPVDHFVHSMNVSSFCARMIEGEPYLVFFVW